MLYLTTRTDRDAFTYFRAVTQDRGPAGGQYFPMTPPKFDEAELEAAKTRSFNQNIAHVLNLLYRTELTGWDVDLLIGKRPIGLLDLDSRTIAAEVWRNYDCPFEDYVRQLFGLIIKEPGQRPGQWFTMSVRIAVLFGIYGELMARRIVSAEAPMDIAVPSMDFQLPMAAWYARSWGLPIGTIIICCNENNAPWTLLHQGQMRTDAAVRHTITAACDQAVPAGLERLIFAVLGMDEVKRFAGAADAGRPYELNAEQRELLRSRMAVSVVSQRRMHFMLPNLYSDGRWTPDIYSAMAYAGLVDHRSRAGETGTALVLCEEDPQYAAGVLAKAIGTTEEKLLRRLGRT